MASATRREVSLIDTYSKDFDRLRNQKARGVGGVEARVLMNLCMVFGEQYITANPDSIVGLKKTDEEMNRLFLTFNMVGRALWRKIGRLWSINHQFRATPNTLNPAAYDQAEVVSKLILAINRKTREAQQHWNRLFWLLVGGVVVEHTPWMLEVANEALPEFDEQGNLMWVDQWNNDADISEEQVILEVQRGAPQERFKPKEVVQTVGDIGSELFSPLDTFIDASVKRITDLSGDQGIYLAQIKTAAWIADNFGTDVAKKLKRSTDLSIVKTKLEDGNATVSNLSMRDLVPALQGTWVDGDPDMQIVLTRYSPRSSVNPYGKRCIFIPNAVELDQSDLREFENIPCTDIHWRPNANTFWTGDFITDLWSGQKFLNKRMSQLGESANAQVYEMILLGGDLKKVDFPTDTHGVVEGGLDDNGNPLAHVMQRGQLPSFFNESIRMAIEFIESLSSGDLLSQRKFPGQIRGPLAIPMLQELLDSEDGPVYSHLGEQLAAVHQQRINRVKVFYEPIRTLNYTGANNKDEVLVFHKSQVLEAGWDYNISVDQSSLLPELSSLREARVRERLESPLAALYMNRRTGKIDISKIADDLKFHDVNREDRESQFRKLARQFIGHLWQGQQLDPALPLSFYDHDVMMDEFEAAMSTTEWLEASPQVKKGFIDFYGKCQAYLQKMHEQQQSIMENQMLQKAVAMATQQAAAKAAAEATDAALTQVQAQQEVAEGGAGSPPAVQQMRQMMQRTQRGPRRVGTG